jgi:hypothetical protein
MSRKKWPSHAHAQIQTEWLRRTEPYVVREAQTRLTAGTSGRFPQVHLPSVSSLCALWLAHLSGGQRKLTPWLASLRSAVFVLDVGIGDSLQQQQKINSNLIQCFPLLNTEGESMGNLSGALQQLRAERKQAQSHVEKLDQAISVIESLNGSGTFRRANQQGRIISAASRRKMAQAQRARWAKARKESQPMALAKTTASAPVKHVMSASARRKIAAAQRARWAKFKAQQKKAA